MSLDAGPVGALFFGGVSLALTSHTSRCAKLNAIRIVGTQWLQQNIEQAHRLVEERNIRFAASIEETLDAEFRILRDQIAVLLGAMHQPESVQNLHEVLAEISRIRGTVTIN
jgi:hypothetical protein